MLAVQIGRYIVGFIATIPLVAMLSHFRSTPLYDGSNFLSTLPTLQDAGVFLLLALASVWFANFTIGLLVMHSFEKYHPLETASKGLVYNARHNRFEITSPRLTEYSWSLIESRMKEKPVRFMLTAYVYLFCFWALYLEFTAHFGLVIK